MTGTLLSADLTQAVVPVIAGPLATLVPILIGALVALVTAIGRFFLRLFTPVGMKDLFKFLWHQKLAVAVAALAVGGYWYCSSNNWWRAAPPPPPPGKPGLEWTAFRGDAARSGRVADSPDPTTGDAIWAKSPQPIGQDPFKQFWSSPCVVGDRLYIAATEAGIFGSADRGGIFCLNADTGEMVWSYAPKGFRPTYSSPSVAYKRGPDGKQDFTAGYVVCGEALHVCNDARVVCLNLEGELLWEYRTQNHVESSPAIADGRAYVGSGDDGYWCFDLEPKEWENKAEKRPKPVWHVGGVGQRDDPNGKYHDCETCPIVEDGVFYAGLGNDGNAVVALDAATGKELWRMTTPSPVFCAPTIGYRIVERAGKREREKLMFIAMGNANVLQSAEMVKIGLEKEIADGRETKQRLDLARRMLGEGSKKFRLDGEVWCINLSDIARTTGAGKSSPAGATQPAELKPEWTMTVPKSVLNVSFAPPDDTADLADGTVEGRVYFGAWDDSFYSVSTHRDSNRREVIKRDLHSPMPNTPAIGKDYVYIATKGGTLYCLDTASLTPLWQVDLGQPLVSSPIVARGHVYIGTDADGVRCIGRPERVPPVWNRGTIGGLADRTPVAIPAAGAGGVKKGWQYPTDVDPGFRITAPLMPLPQWMPITEVSKAKTGTQPELKVSDRLVQYLYMAVIADGRPRLLKVVRFPTNILDGMEKKDDSAAIRADRMVQVAKDLGLHCERDGNRAKVEPMMITRSVDFDKPIVVAPAGVGDNIFVVEGGSASSQPDQPGALHMLDLDGKRIWRTDLLTGGSGEFTIDGRHIVIWTGADTLACIDREANGKVLWTRSCPGGKGVGVPSASSGLVAATTTANLTVLDAITGRILWSDTVPGGDHPPMAPTFGPVRAGNTVLVPTSGGIFRISLAEGVVQWHAAIGKVARPLLADLEKVVAVTDDGKLHVLGLEDGLPLRLKNAVIQKGGKKVLAERRLAPVSAFKSGNVTATRVDIAVMPVLAGDRIIFGTSPGDQSGTDLWLLKVPETYRPEPAAAQPLDVVQETVDGKPIRWCETSAEALGLISQPLILVEGNGYVSTGKLGLVFLSKKK